MELSLERYKFAALPNKFKEPEEKKLQPRVSLKLFSGTQILVNVSVFALNRVVAPEFNSLPTSRVHLCNIIMQ